MDRNSIYFNWFLKDLRKDQLEDFNQRSINMQKDWYIRYLENHYNPSKRKKRKTL